MNTYSCHLCGAPGLSIVPSYPSLRRVTSDCKPWSQGGGLGVCSECGTAQAILSSQWEAEARQIYDAYTIYHQSGGTEQSVFDSATGNPSSRSSRLLRRLKGEIDLPPTGRLIDIGCGNGATLRAFNEIAPQWRLAGLDINDHSREVIESIPGVESLYTGDLESVPGQFDIITLIHALEHIAQPSRFLASLRSKLAPGGILVVQVPDCRQNPYMFLVADHATHFFKSTLRATVTAGGYKVLVAADDWVEKELTVLARKASSTEGSQPEIDAQAHIAAIGRRAEWLSTTLGGLRELAATAPLALFGTSIAATWLTAELADHVAFYVDEDPHRAGQTHLGRPIYLPEQAPSGSRVFIALPPNMATRVKERLEQQGVPLQFYVPPPLPGVSDLD